MTEFELRSIEEALGFNRHKAFINAVIARGYPTSYRSVTAYLSGKRGVPAWLAQCAMQMALEHAEALEAGRKIEPPLSPEVQDVVRRIKMA